MSDQEISDRVVLVTGGSRGIGRAVSIGLGRSGARVAVNYVQNESAAKATLAEIEAVGGSGGIYPGDVSNESAVRSMTAEIERTLGPIDMLVTSAGIANAQDHQISHLKTIEALWRRMSMGHFCQLWRLKME